MLILNQILYITYCSISCDALMLNASVKMSINNTVIVSTVAFINKLELCFYILKTILWTRGVNLNHSFISHEW